MLNICIISKISFEGFLSCAEKFLSRCMPFLTMFYVYYEF